MLAWLDPLLNEKMTFDIYYLMSKFWSPTAAVLSQEENIVAINCGHWEVDLGHGRAVGEGTVGLGGSEVDFEERQFEVKCLVTHHLNIRLVYEKGVEFGSRNRGEVEN